MYRVHSFVLVESGSVWLDGGVVRVSTFIRRVQEVPAGVCTNFMTHHTVSDQADM